MDKNFKNLRFFFCKYKFIEIFNYISQKSGNFVFSYLILLLFTWIIIFLFVSFDVALAKENGEIFNQSALELENLAEKVWKSFSREKKVFIISDLHSDKSLTSAYKDYYNAPKANQQVAAANFFSKAQKLLAVHDARLLWLSKGTIFKIFAKQIPLSHRVFCDTSVLSLPERESFFLSEEGSEEICKEKTILKKKMAEKLKKIDRPIKKL